MVGSHVKESITLSFLIESHFTWQLAVEHFKKYTRKASVENAKRLLRKKRKTLVGYTVFCRTR